MRLEEWQKFIESQFLEDGGATEPDAETAEEAAPVKPGAAKIATPVEEIRPVINAERTPAPLEAKTALPYVPVTVRPTVDAASREAKPIFTPPEIVKTSAMTLPFAEMETPVAAPPPETPAALSGAARETPYGQTLDFDAEIPEFASYMPSFRADKSADSAPAAAKIEAKNDAQKETPPAEPAAPHHVAVHENRASAVSIMDETRDDAPIRVERNPRSRARHARNVQPQNVASGLSAADMWADVPRHVQTLLALERIEEKEIAQSSYKRPFAEGRLELIERLLDPILSLEDTARLLNVCPTTVRRYTNRGILTHYRKETERGNDSSRLTERETRQRRFRLSDILAFLETQQSAITADQETERASRRAANKAQSLPS